MNSEEFRKWGKVMVDFVADYWESMRDRQPLPDVKPGDVRKMLPTEAPQNPESWEAIFKDLDPIVLNGSTHWGHPHFFAYFPTANSYPAVMGDMLSDALGTIGFTWNSSPACTEVEMVVMDWLAKMLNLPEEFMYSHPGPGAGMIQCTASDATLVAILGARSKNIAKLSNGGKDPVDYTKLVAYCSDQAHSSVERAGLLAGITIHKVASDKEYAMRGEALEKAIQEDLAKNMIPIAVVATLGTTPTCAFDNLLELGPVCKKFEVWLHIDAAYAGSAFICPEYRHLLNGVEFADTFNFNAHKWLEVNFDCSAMWFRDTSQVEQAFLVDPTYLKHNHQGLIPDFRHWQVPLGRRFRSLKLWFVIRSYGVTGLQQHIRSMCELAKGFQQLVEADKRYTIVAPVHMGLVVFRFNGSNEVNEKIVEAINADRRIHLVPSHLHDLFVIRFAICSTLTNKKDVQFAWNVITEITEKINSAA